MSLPAVKRNPGGLAAKVPSGVFARAVRRVDFDGEPIPPGALAALGVACAGAEVSFRFVAGEAERAAVAALVAEAERALFADPGYRLALGSRWHPRPVEEDDEEEDAGFLLPVPDLFPGLGSFWVSTQGLTDLQARRDFRLAARAPLLVVVAAPETKEGRAAALETARRLVATSEESGLAACFFNQPVFAPEIGRRLAERLALGAPLQLLLAVGVARTAPRG
ncbi:MAG: hypothetical protein ACHQPI_08780 [Thermoanaerobaculia bacterium]